MDLPSLSQIRMEELSLTTPDWLWLLLLIPLFWFVQRFSLVDLSRAQQFLSLVFRALIVACLALAMSGVATKSYSQQMALVVLVDVSPSVPDAAIADAQAYINKLWKQKDKRDVLRVITFSASSRMRVPRGKKAPKIKRHPNETSTDVQAALRHAYGLFPPHHLRRIVLLGDGRETRGSALDEIRKASKRGIRVFSRAVRGVYPPEVLIQDLRLPTSIRLRAPFYMTVKVFSTYDIPKLPLTIYKDGYVFAHRTVSVKRGVQQYRFRAQIDEAGLVSFQAMIRPKRDRFKGNNLYVRMIPIKGKPRVLYLEGKPGQAHYLARALRKQKFDVDVRSSYGVPSRLSDLERYDLVLLSDIPAYRISSRQMRLFEVYARDLGGGVVMVGGENSFGPGGYFQTRMEKLLPVRFDVEKKKETPSLALVLIIDKSGSMSGQRIALAREAAKATVQMLGGNDQVGVVAFDYRPQEVVALQSASNKSRILYDISRIHASGGTRIAPSLNMAYRMLSGARAKVKHVILLSDGQDSRRGIFEIVQAMHADRITVSTIALGQGSARSLLQSIADGGGGRSYFTEDPYNIPKIFTKETSKVTRSSFVEEPFRPKVVRYSQAIKGINFSSAPYLLGYVSTKAKPRSQVILTTELGEPLLVTWRYGLGKVAAFTSDGKNRWAVQWLSWSGFGKFWAQVLRDTMRQGPSQHFQVTSNIREGEGIIRVDATNAQGQYLNHLNAKAVILDPRLKKKTVKLRQTAPGFYEGRFRANRYGAYLIKARFYAKKRFVGMGEASASYAYPAEWLSASPDRNQLKNMAKVGKGSFDPAPAAVWKRGAKERLLARRPLWPYFVMLALFLFMLDVLFRRVRLFGRATLLTQQK
jgi:uncharacterized membrane protein